MKCKDCNEKGNIVVKDYTAKSNNNVAANKRMCPRCDGRGIIYAPTGVSSSVKYACRECNGTGVISI